MKKISLLLVLVFLAHVLGLPAKKVHTIGDSTMAPYDENTTVTRGWGMYFGNFLTDGWTSVNYAKGGRDSRGGYNELWQNAKPKVEAGDYVLIQFAHNDEKISGMDRDELYNYYVSKGMTAEASALDTRGTIPSTTYKQWLKNIVDEVKAKGAVPVLVAPVCRSYFGSDGKIRRNGRHDLGDSFSVLTADGVKEKQSVAANDHKMDYVYHMQQLAKEENVTFIDLTTATAELYESYGDAKCHEQLFDGQGSTHFNTTGALLVARLCAQLMKEQGVLSDAIVVPTDLSVSPATADMGEAYKGQTLVKELTINGFGLTPAEGTIQVDASEGIEVSLDKNTWTQTTSIIYRNGTLVQNFYARIALTAAGQVAGKITVSLGEKKIEVPVTANAIELGGGAPFSATWSLSANDEAAVDGDATVAAAEVVGMVKYGNVNGKGIMVSQGENGAWTKAEDDDPGRYVGFSVTAPKGKTLDIDHIALKVGGHGGNGMMCHVYYSTDGFQTRTTLYAPTSMQSGVMNEVEAQPVIKLEEKQTLQVRVYPWYNADGTGKWLCVQDIIISGQSKGGGLENEPVTISFPFHEGGENQTATFGPDEKMGAYFKTSYVSLGASLSYKGVGSVEQQTLVQPAQQDGSANDDNAINFYFIPKKGMIFVPTKVSFHTTRYGTDGGKVDASWVASDGSVTSISKSISPNRNNKTPNVTEVSETVSGANGSDDLCGLRLNLYSLGNTKQVGFGDIVIEGTLLGTPQEVRQCKLQATLADEKAGKLTIQPASGIYDEGDEVRLSVEENFGYHFLAWVDANGKEVSKQNPYVFNITEDLTLKATFQKAATYSLNISFTDGAQPQLVQIQPVGTIIDGQRMYEEGTDVRLTALDNKVLTFLGWEDQTTSAERTIRMDANKELTARYSATDYIVGWDFYEDAPKSERAADYCSDTENAGKLSLRKADGTTTSWLANGVAAGKVRDHYAVRVWRPITDEWYFEMTFSSKGYEKLHLSSLVGDDYNTYSTIHAQYSTDGENFSTFGTYTLPNRGWSEGEFDLPAEASDKERVFLRFWPDRSSEKVGVESTNDGLMLAELFILAESKGGADEVATLLTSTPAHGSTGVSASGSIVLTFDRKVKAGEGTAMIGSETVAPVISGKSAVFKYTGLKYNTTYTFTMPEGVLLSRSGNKVAATTISFTTMERQQPQARLFDAVVAQDGTGDYLTLQAAIDAAPEGRAMPWLIFVKNGQYKEHIDIPAKKPYLHIIGQDRDKTVVLDDKLCGGDNALHVSVGATVVVNADNTFFENITLENSYGHEKQAGPQALALNTGGDRIALNNVALLSYQDTWITTSNQKNRHYIKNSLIEGAVDFIYNGGDVYLDGDTLEINRPSGGYIVAPNHTADTKWGYVFQNNIIRPRKGINVTDVWLGRPWHGTPKTVFINTQTFINLPAKGWYNTMGGLPAIWAEYNTVDKNGNALDLSQRESYYYVTDRETGQKTEVFNVKNTLTAEEAAQYTLKNVVGGNDNWQPDLMCEACEAPAVKLTGNKIEWTVVPYAICYVVTCNDKVIGFTTDTFYTCEADGTYYVQAVNEYGGLSQKTLAGKVTAVSTLSSGKTATPHAYYTVDGRQQYSMLSGLNMVRMSDGSVKKILMK